MDAYSLDDYDFALPEELIAQQPAPRRDASRLLICDCRQDTLTDGQFPELAGLLASGDLLVFNDTRVFPARLAGHKQSGGKIELLLLEYPKPAGAEHEAAPSGGLVCEPCWGLLRSSKGPKIGNRLIFGPDFQAEVLAVGEGGKVQVRLELAEARLDQLLARYGRMPLPPYIKREAESPADHERYQTVYAGPTGAVAAPTAGLHFTTELLAAIKGQGVELARVTLHVGYGTFAPVRCADIRQHLIHSEDFTISEADAALVNQTKAAGGRIWAVGTTSVRALEAAAGVDGLVRAGGGGCRLYIYPGYSFRVVDNLLTNFHLPKSSLMFLVSALAGRERILGAYHHAIANRYRFFSYGDAMAIITKR